MTKAAALHQFFSSFGMTAYTVTSVPEDAVFPYLTYELVVDAWDGGEVGPGGKLLPCDGGYVWLKRGSPWCQSLRDEASDSIKRRYLNVTAEFLTEN